MSGKTIEELESDPDALEGMDPADIEAAMQGDADDGKGNTVDTGDPRGDPSNAEEERERGSSRPHREAEPGSGKDQGSEGDDQTGSDKGDDDTSAGDEAGSEGSSDSDEGKPVETADGKHTIPYSVLKGEREARKEAQRELEELRKQNPGETTPQSEGGQGHGDGTGDSGTSTDPNAYDWDQIAEEYGDEYARMMRERVEREAELEKRLQRAEQHMQRQQQAEQAQEQETVQGAIDTLPTLASWQSQDPAMFEAAKAIDSKLAQDPEWKGASYSERFAEVVRRLRPDAAELQGSGGSSGGGSDKSSQRGSGGSSDQAPPPTSHSDTPAGGAPPDARSEVERLQDADATEIEARMETMTPEQQEEFLAGL